MERPRSRLRLPPLLKRPLHLLPRHRLLRPLPTLSPCQRPPVPLLRRSLINFQPKPARRGTARPIRSFGSIYIRRSITTRGTKPTARQKRARTCASGIPLHKVCAPPKMRSALISAQCPCSNLWPDRCYSIRVVISILQMKKARRPSSISISTACKYGYAAKGKLRKANPNASKPSLPSESSSNFAGEHFVSRDAKKHTNVIPYLFIAPLRLSARTHSKDPLVGRVSTNR